MEALERYRWLVGEVLAPRQPERWHRRPSMLDRVRSLSEGLCHSRADTVGQLYLEDDISLAAYLAYFAPWNMLRLDAMLGMQGGLPAVLGGASGTNPTGGAPAAPVHIVDLGAGPLVCALYFALAHPQLLKRQIVWHAVDAAPLSIDVGKRLLRQLAPDHSWQIRTVPVNFDDLCASPELVPWAEVDLVLDSFSLNEWARSRYRREKLLALVTLFGERLRPGVEVIAIEPGNRESGRLLPALRAELLAAGDTKVLGPCTHQATCPLVRTRDRSWCHFRREAKAPDWLVEVGAQAGLPKEKLFFSYLHWRYEPPAAAPARKARPQTRVPVRIIGAPMQLGARRDGIYGCDESGRVLLYWAPTKRPPAALTANGAIITRLAVEAKHRDLKSGAALLPFPGTEPPPPPRPNHSRQGSKPKGNPQGKREPHRGGKKRPK